MDIYKEVMERIGTRYYEMQNFDFGEFPPEDEDHFMQIYEEFLDGIQHKREMSPKKIIELAVEYTLKLTQAKSKISSPNKGYEVNQK